MDDSFFDNPLEVSEQDDVISMRSMDMGEEERDMIRGQNDDKVPGNVEDSADQPTSQGSDPKWDEYARKVREKKKKDDEERFKKEKKDDEERLKRDEEKIKKKQGRNWFMKNRKDPKDKTDNNFVKRKESEQTFDTTASSTNTLTNTPTNTPCNTLTNTSSNNLTDTPSSHKSETKPARDTPSEQAPSSNKPARPPLPRKKKLQRQNTLNEESRPSQPESTEPVSSDISVPTSLSSEYVTASSSLSESGTQGYASDTLRDVLALPVVDEISEAGMIAVI